MSLSAASNAAAALQHGALFSPLAALGSVHFEGADAAAFLQGQLSSDVRTLDPGALQRSSYVSPKGRVLANLVLWRAAVEDASIGALVAADLAATIAKRLSLFVLRAKVKVRDATAERARVGVAGPEASRLVQAVIGRAPLPGQALDHEGATLLGLPDGRVIIEVEASRSTELNDALAARAVPGGTDAWQLAQVRCGAPFITAATSDQFVPQALNLDVLGAVSFQKGCYPGQEIVARTQYLGRLKERLFAFRADVPAPAPGTRLFCATFGEQACGTVINAATVDEASAEILAVVQRAIVDTEALHVGAPDGPVLTQTALPYAVPEPAQPRGRLA